MIKKLLYFWISGSLVYGVADTVQITITIQDQLFTDNVTIPDDFKMYAPYPNPFNNSVKIVFDVPMNTVGRMEIYDINGKNIFSLPKKNLVVGRHDFLWKGYDSKGKVVPTGIYFVAIETDKETLFQKISLVK